ncbi:MAG: hypothetical protein XXXJIFNMEKO3_03364 [Candidatus Erwinia impunctatus]
MPGSVLAGNSNVHATLTATDAAGNSSQASADHAYRVDTTAPVAGVGVDAVTADNVINATEAGQNVPVTGTISGLGAGETGTVTVKVGDQSYSATVSADGKTWSANVPGSVLAGNSNVHATLTATDAAGNSSQASADHAYRVDTTAPTASVGVDAVTTDNVINATEAGQNVPVTGTISGLASGETGTVTVKVGDQSYSATVSADGKTWSANVPGSVLAGNSNVHATLTATDAAGNSSQANADHAYSVDTVAPVSSGSTVTGTEDTTLQLNWKDLGVSTDTAKVVINSLPPSNTGTLYYNDHGTLKAVLTGQTFTDSTADLYFVPTKISLLRHLMGLVTSLWMQQEIRGLQLQSNWLLLRLLIRQRYRLM